jgi:hypothetical protein
MHFIFLYFPCLSRENICRQYNNLRYVKSWLLPATNDDLFACDHRSKCAASRSGTLLPGWKKCHVAVRVSLGWCDGTAGRSGSLSSSFSIQYFLVLGGPAQDSYSSSPTQRAGFCQGQPWARGWKPFPIYTARLVHSRASTTKQAHPPGLYGSARLGRLSWAGERRDIVQTVLSSLYM